MVNIRLKPRLRAILYVVASIIIGVSIERGHIAFSNTESLSRFKAAAHAPSYNLLFVIGMNFLVVAMCCGRCGMLRCLFLSNTWRCLSGLMPTFNMMGPIVALCYFLSTYAQLSMTFGM